MNIGASGASGGATVQAGEKLYLEGISPSTAVGAEKVVRSVSSNPSHIYTNAYSIYSLSLFRDLNFDDAINSNDYAAASLSEYGWKMPVASNILRIMELKTDVLIPGYKILSLTGDAQIRVWKTPNPTINDTPLLITGQTVTNGFNGASFGASPISMLYVEALDSGVATLTYSYVGTGSAEELGCSASLGMTVVKVEFDQLKVDTRNINQIDTGKYKDYKKCIAVQWVLSKMVCE